MQDDLKRETIPVPDGYGRDVGKTFLITEWPALRAERWAMRLAIALKGTAGYIPTDLEKNIADFGMVGVMIRGLNAVLAAPINPDDVIPLLDEMLQCVKIIRDPKHPEIATALTETDIREIRTVEWLRGEVIRVHTGFSFAEALAKLTSAMKTEA
jgi:hypothetical protein